MRIEVLGAGCSRCDRLFHNVQQAVAAAGVAAVVEKVQDVRQILAFDVLATPALVIDGLVCAAGRVPGIEEIKELIAAAARQ
jgi:small redox-active disulfide protein 2